MIPQKLVKIVKATDDRAWIAGAVGGLAGQFVFGLSRIVYLLWRSVEIPAIYQQIVNWGPYLASSLVLGLGFAVLVSNISLATDNLATSIVLGFGYGLLTWLVPLPTMIAIGLGLLGVPATPVIESFGLDSFGRHVVYGLVLGIVYPQIRHGDRIDWFSQ